MDSQVSPQLPAVGEINSKPTYASFISAQGTSQSQTKIQLKNIDFNHGEPTIKFTMEEIKQYSIEEGLHQALVLKFSYGQPEMTEMRKMVPRTLGIKGQCIIGWLARRHILIRFDKYEDYVAAASRIVNNLHCNGEDYMFRVFPWSIGFNPKEESSRAFTWISLPNLPPELFARRALLSIASAAGKPIAIDKATQEKSRPSTARVKIELDLLDKHPEHIRVQYIDEKSGKVIEHVQAFVYDNLPMFCNYCKHQGHEEGFCRLMLNKKCDNKQSEIVVEQYKGDVRVLLNEKRRNRGVDIGCTVVDQQGNTTEQNLGENEIMPVNKEQKLESAKKGDQLIAAGAITDPIHIVSTAMVSTSNAARDMVCKANERIVLQGTAGMVKGTTNGIEQNTNVYAESAITEECAVVNNGQTVGIDQHGVINPNRNKGKEVTKPLRNNGKGVLVYVEKGNLPLLLKKPAGIKIGEPLPMPNVATSNTQTDLRRTTARKQIDVAVDENRAQLKNNDEAGNTGKGNCSADPANAEWTTVTKRKTRRLSTNNANASSNVEQQIAAGDDRDQLEARLARTDSGQQTTDFPEKPEIEVIKFGLMAANTPEQSETEPELPPFDRSQKQINDRVANGGANHTKGADVTGVIMESKVGKQGVTNAVDGMKNNFAIKAASESTTVQGHTARKTNATVSDQIAENPRQRMGTENTITAMQATNADIHNTFAEKYQSLNKIDDKEILTTGRTIEETTEVDTWDQNQQEGNSHFDCQHTKLGDACENTDQNDNIDNDSHSLNTSSMNNSSNEVDINMMNKVVTGGQHHNSSNWAVLVEEEDDNIGMFEWLYKEESEERNQRILDTLNPNAPDYIPHKTPDEKHLIQGKTQQQTVLDKDRELLDALVYVNPLEMKDVNAYNGVYRKSYFDTELFNSDEEDDMSDSFYKKSVKKEAIPPRQQRIEKAKRQLPMRQAKQKGAGPSTSTRSNKSKK